MVKTILVIDDDTDIKESTQVMLMNEGYKVEVACNGEIGLESYEKNHPDMTFLDIKMPGIDGFETFAKIKEKDHKSKVVLITGFVTDEEKLAEAKKNGLTDIIKKPFYLTDLLKSINKHLR